MPRRFLRVAIAAIALVGAITATAEGPSRSNARDLAEPNPAAAAQVQPAPQPSQRPETTISLAPRIDQRLGSDHTALAPRTDGTAPQPDDLGTGAWSGRRDRLAAPLPVTRPARPALAPVGPPMLATMVGQMLMVGFEGDDIGQPGPQRLAEQIARGEVGGVVFFRQNVKSAAAVKRLTNLFKRCAPPGHPLLIAIDQEGGQVQRLTRKVGFANTPSARQVAARGEEAATAIYTRLADDLADWGFNLNLGPVVDLASRRDNPIIAKRGRAYSPDPARVTAFARTFVEAHHRAGLLTSLKHFPGHGSSRGDTHEGFVDVSTSWQRDELTPFRTLIDEGLADMVMVAHVHLAAYAADDLPASLSRPVIEGLLRRELGYRGVVISDDMEMGAIARLGSPVDIAERAVRAGNDILVYAGGASEGGDLVADLQARLALAAADPALARRIGDSYGRILGMKSMLAEPGAR